MAQTGEPKAGTSGNCSNIEDSGASELRDLFKDASSTTDMDPNVWIPKLRGKIITMLKTPLKQEFSAEVYQCIFQMCLFKKRFTWLCSDESKGWTRDEAKHFSFIARLSLNEINILLPHLKQHLTGGDQPDLEDGKVMSRPASAEEYQQFQTHLMILEDTIQALVRDQDDEEILICPGVGKLTDLMDPSELKSLLERMKEVLVDILDYLELVHRHWTQLVAQPTSKQFCASQGALRIALVWVSEDVGSFQSQCKTFFIDLIVKYLLARDLLPDTMPDLLVMALDAICLGDDNDGTGGGMRSALKATPHYRDALQRYLDFVQEEQKRINDAREDPCDRRRIRGNKEYKLRCSLVRDLLKDS